MSVLSMPIKCYRKPNRSVPRTFTEKDAARIAKSVADSGVPVMKILAFVAVAIGLGVMVCKVARFLDIVDQVRKYFLDIIDVGAAIATISTAILVLGRSGGLLLPVVRRVVIALISILGATLVFLRRIQRYQEELQELPKIRERILEACDWVNERFRDITTRGEVIPPQQ